MTGNESTVVVIDQLPSDDDDPRTTAEVAAGRSRNILEGGLLVAVGLSALAVEGIVSAILRDGDDRIPSDGGTDAEGPVEGRAAEPFATDSAAVIAGAALNVAFEAARGFMRIAAGFERAIRPLTLVAMIPPVHRAARRLEEVAIRRNEIWRDERLQSARAAELFTDAAVPQLVDAVIDRLDLTDLVLEHVDLERVSGAVEIDRLIERVDLHAVISRVDIDEIVRDVDVTAIVESLDIDAVAARIDVERIVDRLDLIAIARGVIDELDLPEIIRGSTETMAAETRDGVRVQGMRADRFVSRLVDRALLRQNGGPSQTSGGAPGSTEDAP